MVASGIADWVSAIGSIAAVAAGFILNYFNQRSAQHAAGEQKKELRQDRLLSVKNAVEVILRRSEGVRKTIVDADISNRFNLVGASAAAAEHLRAASDVLSGIEIHRLDASAVGPRLYDLRITVAMSIGQCEQTRSIAFNGSDGPHLEQHRAVALTALDRTIKNCQALLSAVDAALGSVATGQKR